MLLAGFARKKQAWRLLFLSSGEIGLPDLIKQSGQKVRGGHEVRVVDVPAFTGKYGVFDHLHFLIQEIPFLGCYALMQKNIME